MSTPKKGALERLACVLEAAQFNNGSIDITLQGPESGLTGSPLRMIVEIRGEAVKEIGAELSALGAEIFGVATALQSIAEAIRECKKP